MTGWKGAVILSYQTNDVIETLPYLSVAEEELAICVIFILCVCGSVNSLCACQLIQALVYGKYLLNSSFYFEGTCVPGALLVCWHDVVPLPPLGAEA